jgi:carbonic anhydrase
MRYCESTDKEEQCRFCEKESVTVSMGNLLTFPFVSEAVDKGRVALHGWCAWIAGDDRGMIGG